MLSSSSNFNLPATCFIAIIGKSGETIRYLQLQSGAKIQVTRDLDADLSAPTREVELKGNPDQIAKAEQLISDVLNEAELGGSGIVSRRITRQQGGAEKFVMKVPNNKVGLVIGKGGDTIKSMQNSTGARIQAENELLQCLFDHLTLHAVLVIPLHLPPGDTSTERTVQIDASSEQIEAAKLMVNEVISETASAGPLAAYKDYKEFLQLVSNFCSSWDEWWIELRIGQEL